MQANESSRSSSSSSFEEKNPHQTIFAPSTVFGTELKQSKQPNTPRFAISDAMSERPQYDDTANPRMETDRRLDKTKTTKETCGCITF